MNEKGNFQKADLSLNSPKVYVSSNLRNKQNTRLIKNLIDDATTGTIKNNKINYRTSNTLANREVKLNNSKGKTLNMLLKSACFIGARQKLVRLILYNIYLCKTSV